MIENRIKNVYITINICLFWLFLFTDSGFVVLQGTTYWTDLFVRHFLFQSEPVHSIDSDDLLFFVRKKHVKSSSRHMPKYEVNKNQKTTYFIRTNLIWNFLTFRLRSMFFARIPVNYLLVIPMLIGKKPFILIWSYINSIIHSLWLFAQELRLRNCRY